MHLRFPRVFGSPPNFPEEARGHRCHTGHERSLPGGGAHWQHSLGVVAEPLRALGSGPARPGAVGPGGPAAPASGDALRALPHRDTLASHAPLEGGEEETCGSGRSP